MIRREREFPTRRGKNRAMTLNRNADRIPPIDDAEYHAGSPYPEPTMSDTRE